MLCFPRVVAQGGWSVGGHPRVQRIPAWKFSGGGAKLHSALGCTGSVGTLHIGSPAEHASKGCPFRPIFSLGSTKESTAARPTQHSGGEAVLDFFSVAYTLTVMRDLVRYHGGECNGCPFSWWLHETLLVQLS